MYLNPQPRNRKGKSVSQPLRVGVESYDSYRVLVLGVGGDPKS